MSCHAPLQVALSLQPALHRCNDRNLQFLIITQSQNTLQQPNCSRCTVAMAVPTGLTLPSLIDSTHGIFTRSESLRDLAAAQRAAHRTPTRHAGPGPFLCAHLDQEAGYTCHLPLVLFFSQFLRYGDSCIAAGYGPRALTLWVSVFTVRTAILRYTCLLDDLF